MTGLDLGADDYVTKPFSLRELSRTSPRRAAAPHDRGRRQAGGLQQRAADGGFRRGRRVSRRDAVRLTRREFELLRFLVENKNRVVSRDRLLERVWGYDRFIETRSVDVHVGRLRAKLGPSAPQIETVVGLGYRFVD